VELRPGVTTRRAITGRGIVVGFVAGAAVGGLFILLLMMIGAWRLIPSLAAPIGARTCGAGAVAGLLAGLALSGQRDRVLLDGPRARVVAGTVCAAPFLLLLGSVSTGSDQVLPSVYLLLALWCGVAGAMFARWIVHGTLAEAPSQHE
jgi:hypothetical protein